jgi:Holliday junction resolvase RusA-like endonuclease
MYKSSIKRIGEKINEEVIPMMYEFEMIGDVVGKARPRMNTRTGRAYTPTNTKNYEYFLRQWFIREYPNFITIESRVKVTIIAYFGIPKSTSKKKEAEMLANIISPTKKPDADNIVKIVLDAMNKFAFKDDTQVTKLEIEKKYSRTPRIYVKIEEY